MKMDTDLIHAPAVGLTEEEEADMNDWKLPLAFMKKRHSEKIEGSKALAQSWRMKDRVTIWLLRLSLCVGAFSLYSLCVVLRSGQLMLVGVQGPTWSFPTQTGV